MPVPVVYCWCHHRGPSCSPAKAKILRRQHKRQQSRPGLKSIATDLQPDRGWLAAFRLALAACLSFITWMALTSNPPDAGGLFGIDKINHFAAFAVLGFLAHNAYPTAHRVWRITGLVVYAFAIELSQYAGQAWFDGARAAEASDLLADFVGLAVYEALSSRLGKVVYRLSSSHTGQ